MRFTGVLKSAKVLGLPNQDGVQISVRFIAFEQDGEPILDEEGKPSEKLIEFETTAVGILTHKTVVCRANVSLTNPVRLRTLVFGKYPSAITVEGEPQDLGTLTALHCPVILSVEDPTLPNPLPHLIKAELSMANNLAKRSPQPSLA